MSGAVHRFLTAMKDVKSMKKSDSRLK